MKVTKIREKIGGRVIIRCLTHHELDEVYDALYNLGRIW
jgi:hypothetical protein